jgi:hypothetical protein
MDLGPLQQRSLCDVPLGTLPRRHPGWISHEPHWLRRARHAPSTLWSTLQVPPPDCSIKSRHELQGDALMRSRKPRGVSEPGRMIGFTTVTFPRCSLSLRFREALAGNIVAEDFVRHRGTLAQGDCATTIQPWVTANSPHCSSVERCYSQLTKAVSSLE